MSSFKDNQGREWKLKVTFPVLRTMKDEGILDLFSEPDPMQSVQAWLGADTVAQIDAIGIAVEQTEKQAQTYEVYDFAKALDQESIWNGVMCFAESLADFYPNQAKLMRQILSKARAKMESSQAKVAEAIDSGRFNGLIDGCMNSDQPGSGSSSLPDSSELTPAGSASESLTWMAEGRSRRQWDHTASINMHAVAPWAKKTPRVQDFHPYEESKPRGTPWTPENNEHFIRYFCGNN